MCSLSCLCHLCQKKHKQNLYSSMVEHVQHNDGFKSMNGKDILNFPLQVPLNVSMFDFLKDVFRKYYILLSSRDLCIRQEDKELVIFVIRGLLEILNIHKTGDVIKAYKNFETLMDTYYCDNCENRYRLPTIMLEKGYTFYRMRANKHNLNKNSEFYHLPINERYRCSSMRFSIAGYPCFYLGYSKNVCLTEISPNGTMCGLELSNNQTNELKILDLSFGDDQEKGNDVDKFIKAWPLIASCYIVMANEQINRDAIFREEYIIPQMLTAYLRHKTDYNGIRYYSTRNEELDPRGRNEKDFRNVVLFPKDVDSSGYDMLRP